MQAQRLMRFPSSGNYFSIFWSSMDEDTQAELNLGIRNSPRTLAAVRVLRFIPLSIFYTIQEYWRAQMRTTFKEATKVSGTTREERQSMAEEYHTFLGHVVSSFSLGRKWLPWIRARGVDAVNCIGFFEEDFFSTPHRTAEVAGGRHIILVQKQLMISILKQCSTTTAQLFVKLRDQYCELIPYFVQMRSTPGGVTQIYMGEFPGNAFLPVGGGLPQLLEACSQANVISALDTFFSPGDLRDLLGTSKAISNCMQPAKSRLELAELRELLIGLSSDVTIENAVLARIYAITVAPKFRNESDTISGVEFTPAAMSLD
jgi:hypothetical protein